MRKATLALLLPLPLLAQSHSVFPIDVLSGPPPRAVKADGKTHLVYELRLTNFAQSPIQLLSLAVSADDAATPLPTDKDADLEKTPRRRRRLGHSGQGPLDSRRPLGHRRPLP